MISKNIVIETKETTKKITDILNSPESIIYIIDNDNRIKVALDDKAKAILKAHYNIKELMGEI